MSEAHTITEKKMVGRKIILPNNIPKVTDPHHDGVMEWAFYNGKLWVRERLGVGKKWTEAKRVSFTAARISTIATILPNYGNTHNDREQEKTNPEF